jgi:hypothetical protein
MSNATQFDLTPSDEQPGDEPFYIIVSETTTVYETLDAAVSEIGDKFEADEDSFIAEVGIKDGSGDDDVEVKLNQVDRSRIITKLA